MYSILKVRSWASLHRFATWHSTVKQQNEIVFSIFVKEDQRRKHAILDHSRFILTRGSSSPEQANPIQHAPCIHHRQLSCPVSKTIILQVTLRTKDPRIVDLTDYNPPNECTDAEMIVKQCRGLIINRCCGLWWTFSPYQYVYCVPVFCQRKTLQI